MTFNDKFNSAFGEVIGIEGGYTNDPLDSGGETKYGITIATAASYGYIDSMKDLPLYVAKEIYKFKYWDSLSLDLFPSRELTTELFEIGVNLGVTRAGEFLQRSLNVLNDRQNHYKDIKVDGDVGPVTINALDHYVYKRGFEGIVVLVKMINCLQGNFYVELAERREKDERFIYGWYKNRVVI